MDEIKYYLTVNNLVFAFNERTRVMLVWYNHDWIKVNYRIDQLKSFKAKNISMDKSMTLTSGISAHITFDQMDKINNQEILYSDEDLHKRSDFVKDVVSALKVLDSIPSELKEPCHGKRGCPFDLEEEDCEFCKKANAIYEKLNEPVEKDNSIEMFDLDTPVDERIDSFFAGFNFENEDVYEVVDNELVEAICVSGVAFIPKGVKVIGEEVFSGSKLKEVVFSNDVVHIKEMAFENCHSLNKGILINKIHTIGYKAFYECDSLFELALPYNLKRISAHSFERCRNLKTVYIAKNITSIDNQAFKNCNKLEDVIFLGTMDEWMEISKGSSIFEKTQVYRICCIDGELL